jgi:hypothetical protein
MSRANEQTFASARNGYTEIMPTTQTTKRRTAATKRSTTAKKAAGTRARRSAATNASRAKTSAKRSVRQPRSSAASKRARPVIAQAEFVGAAVGNVVQTGVTAGSKAAAAVSKRIAKLI